MTTALRPLSLGELLDRTFSLYRKNFVLFFGISMLPAAMVLVISVLQSALLSNQRNAANAAAAANIAVIAGVSGLAVLIAYFVGSAFSQAAGIRAVSAVHLGKPMSIGEAFSGVSRIFGRVLNIVISVGIRVFGPFVILGLLFAAAGGAIAAATGGGGAAFGAILALVGVVGFIAAIIWTVRIYVKYAVAVPACVVEDLKAKPAMKRSIVLTKGSAGKIITIYVLLFILGMAVAFGLQYPAQFATLALIKGGTNFVLANLLSELVQFVSSALVAPIGVIAIALLYYDERVRKEAFDIELMMRESEAPGAAVAASIG